MALNRIQQQMLEQNVQDRLNKVDEHTTQLADITTLNTEVVSEINSIIANSVTNNKMVKFKKKIYEVDSTVLLPSNVYVDFNRAVFKRKAGSGVFDLVRNADTVNGNTGIVIKNLRMDGNKDVDGLVATNSAHRFGGLVLKKVTDSKIEKATVTGTVNAEDTAGIYFEDCSNIIANNIDGHNNDRTAILAIRSKVKINGSYTKDNLGSGISSNAADYSEYHNIESHNNGYSNVSINGKFSKGSNITTSGSAYSGCNIGHNNSGGNSEGTIVTNLHSYNNGYEGVSIAGSSKVKVLGFELYGNARNNARAFDGASECKFLSGTVRDSAGGQGILLESGKGHVIDYTDVYGNYASGINVGTGVSARIGDLSNIYNNGRVTSANSAGIILNGAVDCYVGDVNIYDDQVTKTQETGLWIAGGSGHKVKSPKISGNKTYQYRETNSPTNIQYADKFYPLNGTQQNSWNGSSIAGYYKDSDGFVQLVGSFNTGTVGTVAFTLPVGFRPSAALDFITLSNNTAAICKVNADGTVILYTSNNNHHVNNVRFKATQ